MRKKSGKKIERQDTGMGETRKDLAIIFDLDGTLWDSTGNACAIWNRVLEKHGDASAPITQEMVEQTMGKTMEEIGELLFPDLGVEERNAILEEFGEEEVLYVREHGGILYEGVEETVKVLYHNYPLYIVSNSQDGYVQAFLYSHHMEAYFQDIEMSGRTGMGKGHNIKLLMERNQIQKAVYIGDTAGDEKATRFAGIPFIYANYGFGEAVSPDAVIQDIHEVPECLKAFVF